MKILTQNCNGFSRNGKKRFEIIAETIRTKNYDAVLLQEVFFCNHQKTFENIPKSSFEDSPQFRSSYEKGFLFLKGGLVTLTKKEPTSLKFYKYDSQGNFFNLQNLFLGKGFLETIVEDLVILNTHTLCTQNYEEILYKPLREQIDQLLEHVRHRKNQGRTVLLGGDFNFSKNSGLYRWLKEELEDLTENIKDLKHVPYSQGDFIFATTLVDTPSNHNSFYVTHGLRYPSDHLGICGQVDFSKGRLHKP
ncbi:MAG: endonuclease/exonuclease/phosphatase family protein [Nanoarchaeota archaeon]|nr:endonuclease/exonuclease/phosphatase family protein [Nanoarchaeota archaeon]MBU1644498.1 endonuclease/exonuclease/phosphatase family protein [Nanoarchaeota archaeon]MBU1976502.1 endonuclease/exonuclease/phosphatase family protein [Nanoarchaeota archaeon]